MDMIKHILALIGGLLIGLYLTDHNVLSSAGLSLDQQLHFGIGAAVLSQLIQVILGGRFWPWSK